MKKKLLAFLFPAAILVSCTQGSLPVDTTVSLGTSSATSEKVETFIEKYKARRETSTVADTNFKNGFDLMSPETTSAHVESFIGYNDEAEKGPDGLAAPYWQMCQWWTPFSFSNATYTKENNTHVYKNESRGMKINTEEGTLNMALNSDIEYQEKYGGPKQPGASWSHFLIQQSFPEDMSIFLSEISELWVNFDIVIEKCDYKGESELPVGDEAAQLLFYLRLFNRPPEGSDPDVVGHNGVPFWFGVPVYDSRYDYVPQYIGGDTGFVGATNSLIYSITSKDYLGTSKLEMGKKYTISLDVLDYIKTAFIYGVSNNYLPNCSFENLKLSYLNFGWELPGEFDVSSTLSNLDVYYVK